MPAPNHVHVLFHDHCFDGVASSATFTRFYRERMNPSATFSYRGLTHKPGSSWEPSPFTDAPVHACVDFRYSPSPKLTWWFDHHQSAFEKPEDEVHFRADTSGQKFVDPDAKSCTRFLARVAQQRFGFDPAPIQELLDWAEIIDGAQFPDARTAVALEAPAMKLMLTIEASPNPELLPRLIADLARRPLSAVVQEPYVQTEFAPLWKAHQGIVEQVKARARCDQGVVTFDLSDTGADNFNKFVSYFLFPEASYTVAVSASPKRAKVSVGFNPWPVAPRKHNIAAICQTYGGGGHAVVGAVSFPPDQIARARQVAAEIAEKLKGP